MKTSISEAAIFTASSFCNQVTGRETVGSKVTDMPKFLPILTEALAFHDPATDEVKGQSCVELPITDELLSSVASGVGLRTRMGGVPPTVSPFPLTPEDEEVMRTGSWRKEIVLGPECYVSRLYRGVVGCYLHRDFALPVETVRVIVYTLDAYRDDPDVSTEEYERVTKDFDRIKRDPHVIVAVLADAGPKSPLSPHRFAANFAGNNVMRERYDEIMGTIELAGIVGDSVHEQLRETLVSKSKKALNDLFFDAAEVTAFAEKYCIVAD